MMLNADDVDARWIDPERDGLFSDPPLPFCFFFFFQ